VIDKLLQQSDIDLDEIEVTVMTGDVTLTGTVNSRRTKHRIEDIVDSVWGVKEITNNLKVAGGFFGGVFGNNRSDRQDTDDRSTSRSSSSTGGFSSGDHRSSPGTPGGTTGSSFSGGTSGGGSSAKPR
jgi:hypothetical protein